MDVKLEVGMTAIRRDGKWVGPILETTDHEYPFTFDGTDWQRDGKHCGIEGCFCGLVAAGYPWATLGAQVGDTVRLVWNGYYNEVADVVFVIQPHDLTSEAIHPDSLYVITARAAKPADRPRAAHKLDLRDGDVVELVGWQSGETDERGSKWTFKERRLRRNRGMGSIAVPSALDKGHRPLFRVVSRAAEQQPDEVIVLHSSDVSAFGRTQVPSDTHRFTITFPAGGDVGTVTREKL